jgi:hypothetical protein
MSASELATLSILLVEPSPTQHKIIASHLNEEGVVQIDSVDSQVKKPLILSKNTHLI